MSQVLAVLCVVMLATLLMAWDRRVGPPAREAWALLPPIGMLWALNYRALGFWWLGDDPCHLVQILDFGIWKPFIDPVGYFLTPLLNFSLGVDLKLFGLDPGGFYAHQLISFTLLLAIGYGFLRAYLRPAFASLAATLFVCSAPAVAVAQQQMNRHYLEGLALLLGSFVLYRRSLVIGRFWIAGAGALLYFLATAAKEVFVPMVFLLPWLGAGVPGGDGVHRWRHALPYGLALGAYGLWRLLMLGAGNSLTAYGSLSGQFDGSVLWRRIPRLMGLTEGWQAMLAVVLLAIAVLSLTRRSKLFGVAFGATVLLLALPLLPVAGRIEPRHLFLATFAVAAMLAAALQSWTGEATARPPRRLARTLAGTGLAGAAFYAATLAPLWTHLEGSSRHHRAEGLFVLGESDGVLLTSIEHTHHLQCLKRLARDLPGQVASTGSARSAFCGDLCYCSGAFPEETFQHFDGSEIVSSSEKAPDSCDSSRALAVEMHHDPQKGQLSWRLGPYEKGTYQALLVFLDEGHDVSIPITIPREGQMPFRLTAPLYFVIKYRSPEGWQTYSSIHEVPPGGASKARSTVSSTASACRSTGCSTPTPSRTSSPRLDAPSGSKVPVDRRESLRPRRRAAATGTTRRVDP